MKTKLKPLMFVALTTLPASVLAEDVAVPVGQQGANPSIERPKSGLSMDQVSSKFGSPNEQKPAVGNPPITRWVYDAYTVYFENDRVIHSVMNYNR